jgi:hypothetical protein
MVARLGSPRGVWRRLEGVAWVCLKLLFELLLELDGGVRMSV